MANRKLQAALVTLAVTFGMALVACGGGSIGGGFTLTDIPAQYNGKYAILTGMNLTTPTLVYVGCQSVSGNDKNKLSRISNGKVTLPMWTLDKSSKVKKYSGSDSLSMVSVSIFDSETQAKEKPEQPSGVAMFMSISFSNGSASKSWEDGMATGNPMIDAVFDSIKGIMGGGQ